MYLKSYELGLKAIAVYRDGCKATQAVSTSAPKDALGKTGSRLTEQEQIEGHVTALNSLLGKSYTAEQLASSSPGKLVLTRTRNSITHEVALGGHKFRITASLTADGKPAEIYLVVAKVGSTLRNFAEGWAMAVSLGLRAGVPVEKFIQCYEGTSGEPCGITDNPDIRIAKSFMDYVARWLELEFVTRKKPKGSEEDETVAEVKMIAQGDPCVSCGKYTLVRSGSCFVCKNCGDTTGCS